MMAANVRNDLKHEPPLSIAAALAARLITARFATRFHPKIPSPRMVPDRGPCPAGRGEG
jgi:hypothetical protein